MSLLKNKVLQILSFSILVFFWNSGKAQLDSAYSIIVAGHAYGAHAGTNLGLHPPFLEKLKSNIDSSVKYIFLTGDIVNHSTTESWQQVAKELSEFNVNSCYVMGNHGNNSVGHQVFQEKHGGTYYSFTYENELFIVLNSTESDRSISPAQLVFLDEALKSANSAQNRIFIFFHEIIWNSNEKYRLVRSNSRSRYDQMIYHSNFWNEVFPMFTAYPEKKFYVIAGDVGGNPDAIAASYDKWDNVTLLSSGMGEVMDENYMKVDILTDTVKFTLIPLNDDVEMHPITWYNIPESPAKIEGPETITSSQSGVKYQVEPVSNATSYQWNLSDGIVGSSDSTSIFLDFNESFKSGEISVNAINDGFGESEPVALEIKSGNQTSVYDNAFKNSFTIQQNGELIQISYNSNKKEKAYLKIYDTQGSILLSYELQITPGLNYQNIYKFLLQKRIIILEFSTENKKYVRKIMF